MDTAQGQQRDPKRRAENASGGVAARSDVFDQLGNDHLLAHVEEQKQRNGVNQEESPSILSALGVTAESPEEQAAVARTIGPVEDPKQAAAVAQQVGIDPVLIMDERDVGSSDAVKKEVLGEEGEKIIDEKIDTAVATFGAVALDATGRTLVTERLTDELSVEDILEARRQNKLDQLLEEATRRNALKSRDEVIFLLQQLMNDEGELRTVLTSSDPGAIAVQLIEYLAVMLVDFSDLYSLAAYDHSDITRRVVITDDALNKQRTLSPLALKMGGFGSVLYQLVVNELAMRPLALAGAASSQQSSDPAAAEDPMTHAPRFRQNLFSLINQFRLFRTTAG